MKSALKPLILSRGQYAKVIKHALTTTVNMMTEGQAKKALQNILDGDSPKKAIEKAACFTV